MLFDVHNHAVRVLGGVSRRGTYHSMRTAIDKVGRSKTRTVNARFAAMVSLYMLEAEFCNPAAAGKKARSGRTLRTRAIACGSRHRMRRACTP
jgi:transposase